MLHRRKQRTRRGALALIVALCLGTVALPGTAQAYQQSYCGVVLAAGYECLASGLHSIRYNAAAGNGFVCQYLWNAHNGVRRGNYTSCAANFTSRDWGPTGDAWYNGRVINGDISPFVVQGNEIA